MLFREHFFANWRQKLTESKKKIIFQGFYGEECNSICTCQNGGTCDHVTGECRCPPGVKGVNCEDGCPPGRYGELCDKVCPKICPTGYCDRRFGFCECLPGFFGPNCNSVCPDFTFGANCNKQCECVIKQTTKCNPAVSDSNSECVPHRCQNYK